MKSVGHLPVTVSAFEDFTLFLCSIYHFHGNLEGRQMPVFKLPIYQEANKFPFY